MWDSCLNGHARIAVVVYSTSPLSGCIVFLLPKSLDGMPNRSEELGGGLLDPSPGRDIVFQHVGVVPTTKSVDWGIIEFVVEDSSSVIFDGVFYRRDGNDSY